MKKLVIVTIALLYSFLGANMLFADTTPDAFHFNDRTNVAINTEFKSNAITVSGIDAAAQIYIEGGTYSINGGAYTSASGSVSLGNTVKVRKVSASTYSTTKNATLTIGGINDTFSVTTRSATTPDVFHFIDKTNVALNTEFKSNAITVSGLGVAAPISITGGTYSVNGGTYASASSTVVNGNTVKVRKVSASTYSTTKSATLTIGSVSDTFSVTTMSGDYTSANIGTLKYVPAGAFLRDGNNSNLNISTVTTAFRMSEKEITQAQYFTVTGNAPSHFTLANGHTNDTNRPVENMTWYDAVEFCNDLSTLEGFTPVYTITNRVPLITDVPNYPITSATVTATWTNNGYRLPTEMEWEWAAMGATSGSGYTSPTYLTGYGKPFAGSDSILANGTGGTNVIGDYAWYMVNSGSTTHPVGTTGGTTDHSNELGLYDMSGNVWEWCWDWYAAYPDGALASNTDAGRGAASGDYRVDRGGSWELDASDATVARRGYFDPFLPASSVGFRVVRP